MSIILTIAYINLGIWIYLMLVRGGYWRADCHDNLAVSPPATWPEITVIIPARNEADIIGNTLPSLLTNDYPLPLRVVMVDDRSEDATAQVAADIAAKLNASDRLTVIRSLPAPAGWKGKVWAMQCGLDFVAGMDLKPGYILFTDADIAYDKGSLTKLVARAASKNLVLASHMVKLRCQSRAEHYLIPAFVYFFQLLYPPRWINRFNNNMAAAAGGCMLVKLDALQKAGGMKPIHTALIDDCALGRVMKKQGPIEISLTQEVHSLRAYTGVADIRSMVSRTAYDQLDYSPVNLVFSVLGMLLVYIAPVLLSLFAIGLAHKLGLACLAAIIISYIPLLRFYGRPLLQTLTLSVVALFYMWFTFDSAWQYLCGRGGLWKGRVQAERQTA